MIDLNAIRANAADSKRRIGEMCANLRPPKMSIPVSPNDDDEFICRTLDDLLAYVDALTAENAALRKDARDEINHLSGYAEDETDGKSGLTTWLLLDRIDAHLARDSADDDLTPCLCGY